MLKKRHIDNLRCFLVKSAVFCMGSLNNAKNSLKTRMPLGIARVALLMAIPVVLVIIFYISTVSTQSGSPYFLVTLTGILYIIAIVKPFVLEKEKSLRHYFYGQKKLNMFIYISILVETVFILAGTFQFSCSCIKNPVSLTFGGFSNNNFWLSNIVFLYLAIALLCLQTKGFREFHFGMRSFYFKTPIIVGIGYSFASIVVQANHYSGLWEELDAALYNLNDLFNVDDILDHGPNAVFDKIRYALGHLRTFKDALLPEGIYRDLQEARQGDACSVINVFNHFKNITVSAFPKPFNYLLLSLVNLDLFVGLIFCIFIVSIFQLCFFLNRFSGSTAKLTGD